MTSRARIRVGEGRGWSGLALREPAFERLGQDAAPEQVLDLKVCDPAMGSGAFLVEACRAIGERLVKGWERWPEFRPSCSCSTTA